MNNWLTKYENQLSEIKSEENKKKEEEKKKNDKREALLYFLKNNDKLISFIKELQKIILVVDELNSKKNTDQYGIRFKENIFGRQNKNSEFIYIELENQIKTKNRNIILLFINETKISLLLHNRRVGTEYTGSEKVYKNKWISTEDGFEQDYDYVHTGTREVFTHNNDKKYTIKIHELNSEFAKSIIGWLLFENNKIENNNIFFEVNGIYDRLYYLWDKFWDRFSKLTGWIE